jgi:hypothetical protein
VLTQIGNYNFRVCNALTSFEAPVLTQIGNYNFRVCNALTSFEAPVLTQIGDDNFIECNALTSFEAPVLTQIGNDNFYECNALTSVTFGKNKFNVKSVDRILTVINTTKSTKGIKLHSGFIFNSMQNSSINSSFCFLAEKDGFYAHGKTVKEAISDVQFKIVAEKLKNEPIYENTMLTVKHYRLITGACDLGCRNFMEQNGIEFEVIVNPNGISETVEKNPISAKELLPILEKSNAYGYEKFKQLIQF